MSQNRFAALWLACTLTSACVGDSVAKISPTTPGDEGSTADKLNISSPSCAPLTGATGLKYFGFFASSVAGVGTGSYTDELKDFVNLIHVGGKDIRHLRQELEKARSLNLKVMADACCNIGIDFPSYAGGSFDYWWSIYEPIYADYVNDGTIIGFYVSDDAPVSHAQDRDLHIIKTSFSRPVVTVNIVQNGYQAGPGDWSSEIDWVGVETYSGVDQNGINYLLSAIPASAKLVLVPPMSTVGPSQAVYSTLALATNNPRVVAVIPFLWQNVGNIVGARNIPEYVALARDLGACIKGSPTPPPARVLKIEATSTSGSGVSGVLHLVASDTYGAGQIVRMQALVSSSGAASGACLAYYDASSGTVGLLNDSATAWSAFNALGSGAPLENSQCKILPASSTATRQANTVSLDLAVEFKPSFAGTKGIWAEAYEPVLGSSGYVSVGSWAAPQQPTFSGIRINSITPSSGSGSTASFTVSVEDSRGGAQVDRIQFLISSNGSGAGACLVYFAQATRTAYLMNDAGNAWSMSGALGGAAIENSQCRVRLANSSASAQGTTLQLTLAIDLKSGFAGQKTIWAEALDPASGSTDYQSLSSWFVQ